MFRSSCCPLGGLLRLPSKSPWLRTSDFKRLRSGKSEEEWSFTVFFKTAVKRGSQSCAQHDFLHITRGVTIHSFTRCIDSNPDDAYASLLKHGFFG